MRSDTASTRPPGMHDVARLARVSHQTVSRVLNDHPHVRPATRSGSSRRSPSSATAATRRHARWSLRRSGVIGLLTPRADCTARPARWLPVEVAAREAGYFVSLASVADASAAALGAAVEHFKDQAAEAVVLIAPEFEWLTAAGIVATDIPVVTMCADSGAIRPSLVGVAMDNRARRPHGDRTPRRARTPQRGVRRGSGDIVGGEGAVELVARRDGRRRPGRRPLLRR